MAKVLIVDDEPGVRGLLVHLMRADGHETAEATNGVKALEYLEEAEADLIITDLRMPDMHGLALLELVKKRVPHIPVILVTAYASTETVIDAVRLGVFDYLEKPFQPSLLREVAARALAAGRYASRALDGYAGSNQAIIAFLAGGGRG